jgi:DNA replication protein DnaD
MPILAEFNNKQVSFMKRTMFDYTKTILERVSFDPLLFCKELEKALKTLLPYEVEQLTDWLLSFTNEKPELRQCLILVNK